MLTIKSLPTATLLVLVIAISAGAFLDRSKVATESRTRLLYALSPTVPQGSGYAYRRTITIDHTKVPNTDQSNFPLLVSGTYSYLATISNGGYVQNANGYDVIFTFDAACATKLDHEVESYNATTGAVNYWVRVPSLSHTTDTTIYLCYGNSAITTNQSNKTGVWDSNFKAVYHLNDQAANTTVIDATANASNGVNGANTSGKSVSGKVGHALTYNGSTDNTATGVAQTTSFTWECWFKLTDWTTQSGSSNYSTLMAGAWSSNGPLLMLWKDSRWLVQFATDNSGGITSGANSVAPGSWHHAAYTRTGNNGAYTLYLDGEWKGQVASGTNNGNSTITLGTRADYTSQALNGLFDEARVSNVARSADWIKTQYNNQSSPATFYTISASNNCCDTSTARLDPMNATGGDGENPLSRNFNWTLPLVGLPGRAGMDLSLSLSYNSLVWTKVTASNYISFDDDRGFPSPGFRLGFPVIQFPSYYNAEVGKNAFLLIGSDGKRTELRQVGTSTLYEAADSSYLLLDVSTMVLRTTNGTQLKYELKGSDYQCTEIKDRNGNYVTINYTAFGRVDSVIDTLSRNIKFNYDANGWLTSITQIWNQGALTHNWATFEYTNTTIQTNFSGLTVSGPPNNSTIKTLAKVTLADGSHHDFSYTSWGQVWKVSYFSAEATPHLLNYRSYDLPQTADPNTPFADCPRFTERRDWAENWNQNVSGVEQEAITIFALQDPASWTMPDGSSQSGKRADVTTPDGTVNKIYYIGTAGSSGWRRGLPALVETYSDGNWQRKVTTTWTQDNTAVSYPLNPRITETNVYDPAGNRARVETTYEQVFFANGTSCQLPRDVYEYAADAATKLRSTRTDYNTSSFYTDRRIIGLVSEKRLFEGDVNGQLMSKIGFFYDNDNGASSIQGNDAPIHHDNTNYTASFVTGRANLSSVRRYDVNNTAQFTTTRSKYNTAGAVVSTSDALDHTTQIGYSDSFSDNVSRNTLGYPTTITDPDNYIATTKYNFDFGAVTYTRTPQPNTTQNLPGPEQTITYDTIGRLQQVTNQVNGAYTRYVYSNTMTRIDTYATIQSSVVEAHSFSLTDGAGGVIGTATEHPGSVGGYSGQKFVYDVMGRVIKTSNPTETSASGAPSQWVAAGDDAAAGWIYTEQTYDWKGRPLITTNQDGTTKTASYSGCGCAGGEVATLTDEGTVNGGVAKRRQQKIYSDVLGRIIKNETLNWEGGTVYSATVNTYNARDQVTLIRDYTGPEGSLTHQDTTSAYDGYGRLNMRHVPEQITGANTVWTYNADDTLHSVTDARGASATYGYNARHLLTSISYSTPTGVTPTANAAFTYDAVGNRTLMTDGSGSTNYQYDLLSRMNSETRQFTGPGAPAGNFTLSYEYSLAGAVKKVTDERASTNFSTTYDAIGRVSSVTAVGYGGANTTFISNTQYRAWGAPKSVVYGNGTALSVSYDSRLRMAAQVVAGFRMSWVISPPVEPFSMEATYQYYDDGRLKLATRRNPSGIRGDLRTHDRAFDYDHAGRVREAYSGAEAHQFLGENNSGVDQGPYRLSFTYDARDNMLSGGGRYWSRANETTALFNSQNRNPDWEYDPDGRLISRNEPPNFPPSQPLRVTYDAAGQSTLATQVREYFEPIIQQMVSISLTNSQTFDGDGSLVRYKKERLYSTLPANNNVEVTFHLRSTVLGGVGISEYNGSGTWQRGQVYAGHEVVGELTKTVDGSQARAIFRQSDPLTGDELNSRENGDFGGESVIDPQGVDVAGTDPFPADGSGDPDGNVTPDPFVPAGRGEGMLLAAGESGMKCVLDGITVDCAFVGTFAVECPENDCGPRIKDQYDLDGNYIGGLVTNPFQAFTDGWSGFTLSGTRYVGDALVLGRFWTNGASERIGPESFGFGTRTEAYSAHFISPPQQRRRAPRRQRIRRPTDDLPKRGPEPPKYPPVTASEINIVYGGGQFEFVQDDIVNAIVDIANRQACSDAFKKYGLTIPYDVVKSGSLRVAGRAVLYQPNAPQLLGWSTGQVADAEATFRKEDGSWFFGLWPSYTADISYRGTPTVVYNSMQVRAARFGGVKEVVTHSFIHLGGRAGNPAGGSHDLASFAGYKEIVDACR